MAKIVVLGAGGPAGVNVCRALHTAGHEILGLDSNRYHLPWAEPYCSHVMQSPDFGPDLARLLTDESQVDLVHSQPEQGVVWLANTPVVPSMIPSLQTIERTQDKLRTAALWAQAGLRRHDPVPITVEEGLPDTLHLAANVHGLPFWLRATKGAGARGATLVEDLRTGYHWCRYWATRNSDIEWVAEEFLPGRDFCWSSLWHDGELIASFARERLEWIYPHLAPSGRTGTPTVAVTIHDTLVCEIAAKAVTSIDPEPQGLYMVDLREDGEGNPVPTEINAGRFATTTPLYSELGPNMADMYVRLSQGEKVEPLGDNIYAEGIALLRHIDVGHVFRRIEDIL